jgi:hypothetical protein
VQNRKSVASKDSESDGSMMERIIFFVVLVTGLFAAGVYAGKSYCERAHVEQEIKQIRADAKTVDRLRTEDDKREVIYRNRIKTVRETVDNCLAQPIATPVLDRLRDATGAAARSPTH